MELPLIQRQSVSLPAKEDDFRDTKYCLLQSRFRLTDLLHLVKSLGY